MLELPSKIKDRNYVCMPVERMVIESDEEYSRCGKWILTNFAGSLLWIDEVWTKVQVLLENGTLIRIKASTAAMKNSVGTVLMCFTRPGMHEIKRAAEEIRKIVNFKGCMYYKINYMSENGIYNRYGHKRISIYMHTFKGFFYRNSATDGWVLESASKNKYQRCKMSLKEKDKTFNLGVLPSHYKCTTSALPSKSKELLLTMASNSTQKEKYKFNIHTMCSLKEDENGLTEADKVWVISKTLMDRDYIRSVTCSKKSATAEFRFFPYDTSSYMSLIKICHILCNEADFSGFFYFKTSEMKNYKYSAEGELYEFINGIEKFIFSTK